MSAAFWGAQYVNCYGLHRYEGSLFNFNLRVNELDENELQIVENAPELVGDLFNDGDYDDEACTVLSFLGNAGNGYLAHFRKALEFIDDDDETFVQVGLVENEFRVATENSTADDYDFDHTRMSLTELKVFGEKFCEGKI